MSVNDVQYREFSIVVTDEDGRNIRIHKSHTPNESITIEHADRWDLLIALMRALAVDPQIIAIVDPRDPRATFVGAT
jgi:hypothetical protein